MHLLVMLLYVALVSLQMHVCTPPTDLLYVLIGQDAQVPFANKMLFSDKTGQAQVLLLLYHDKLLFWQTQLKPVTS
jgi:hypothetical protein